MRPKGQTPTGIKVSQQRGQASRRLPAQSPSPAPSALGAHLHPEPSLNQLWDAAVARMAPRGVPGPRLVPSEVTVSSRESGLYPSWTQRCGAASTLARVMRKQKTDGGCSRSRYANSANQRTRKWPVICAAIKTQEMPPRSSLVFNAVPC